ncbi:LPXTG cell wall anchor domain-containing protein [Hyphomonas sp.]
MLGLPGTLVCGRASFYFWKRKKKCCTKFCSF